MATKKTKSFTINAKGEFWAGITITADSLEDALAQARNLKVGDFIEFVDEHCDSSCTISGVHES
jgi:hypothetical protein